MEKQATSGSNARWHCGDFRRDSSESRHGRKEIIGMNRVDEYSLFVPCSGLAGKLLAWTLVKQGKRAAVLHRKLISGSYPKEGAWRTRMDKL